MENQNPIKNTDEFIKKVLESKKREKFDLSADEDLSLALMNLISLEEHFFFSGAKGKDEKYFNLLDETRKIRIELMKKIEKNPSYEDHCIMKHLLAGSMRLIEVGTKKLSEGKKEEAYNLFDKAYNLYSLFWGINLKLIDAKDIKKIDDDALNKHDKKSKGFMGKLGELVQKIIDCCIE
ncbi:MAG: hypothetical protein ACP5IX_03070 [Patescibacteria group bacterium]